MSLVDSLASLVGLAFGLWMTYVVTAGLATWLRKGRIITNWWLSIFAGFILWIILATIVFIGTLAILATVAEGAPFVAPPAPPPTDANYNWNWIIMMVLVFGFFYFLVWRPRKRERLRQAANRFRWYWPQVQTLQDAHKATRQAFWFAVVVVVVTTTVSILAIGGVHIFEHIGAGSLLDAALFGAIAIGLYHHSRFAAVAGLVLYVLEQVYMVSEGIITYTYPYSWIMPLLFTLAFLGGVRGAFAYHRLKRAAAQEQGNESKDIAKGGLYNSTAAPPKIEAQAHEGGLAMTTEERLAKVERELRRVKRWSGWLLVGLALALGVSVLVAIFGPEKAGLQFGASVVNKVRTRRVVLVDDEGRERARLAMTEDGGPGLALFDQAGEKRAALGVDADGPKIVLFDPAGEPICSAP